MRKVTHHMCLVTKICNVLSYLVTYVVTIVTPNSDSLFTTGNVYMCAHISLIPTGQFETDMAQ